MNTEEAIITRRSVKHFDPDFEMSEQEVYKLLSLASMSPTAFNIQNWRYVLVTDKELRKKIRVHAWDQPQVTDASLLIILCADLSVWNKDPDRYWVDAPNDVKKIMVPTIKRYYRDQEQVQRDEAMRSCGIAAQTIMLATRSMGYESCPMDGFDFKEVAKLINLPCDHVISMFVAIGKGIKCPWPRQGQITMDEFIIKNSFK